MPATRLTKGLRFRIALVMTVMLAALLGVLNFYPAQAVRRLIINSKEADLLERARTLATELEGFATLNQENINVSMQVLDLGEDQRILVTDNFGSVIYDNAKASTLAGRYTLLPEIVSALSGNDVFHCRYGEEAFVSSAAVPVMNGRATLGSVYIYDYDTAQADFLRSTQRNIFQISMLLAVIGFVILVAFMVYFGKRTTMLIDGIRDMSAGNYDSRIQISGQDELAEVAYEFNLLADRLQKTEEVRREFVSNASHELKTPLASIKLLSDSILQTEGISKESVAEFLQDINEEIDRLTRITERLLQLTKLDHVPPSAAEDCDLNTLVEKIGELLRENAFQAQVTLEDQVPQGLKVHFDKDGLYQVVFNLMENAIKYNRPGGKVTIQAQKQENGELVHLQIQDMGIGMAPEELPHIFERFYRVDKARSRERGGTGLGLAIVSDWLQVLGGKIQVESVLGQGTTFTVTLPAARPPEEDSL